MLKPKNYDWLIMSLLFLAIIAVVPIGSRLDLGTSALLWLIFGAVVVIGQASLRILSSGLSEIRDTLHEIRGLLREARNR